MIGLRPDFLQPGFGARLRRFAQASTRALNRAVVPQLVARRFGEGSVNAAALRHVAVYPKLGVAFNRIKKNANSTSVILLHHLESGVRENERAAKLASLHLEKMPVSRWPEIRRWHYVVVVRNPYSRVLSAFLNKFAKAKYVEAYGAYEASPVGFTRFLRWLTEGGLEADPHWDLQSKLMLLPLDRYDDVIRFESYASQMHDLLRRRGVGPTPEIDALIGHAPNPHRSAADANRARFYTPESHSLVRALYHEDFARLGYPLEPPSS